MFCQVRPLPMPVSAVDIKIVGIKAHSMVYMTIEAFIQCHLIFVDSNGPVATSSEGVHTFSSSGSL